MIQTFRNKALERLLKEGNAKGVPKDLEKRIRRRLEVIDSATAIDDLKIPGYDLHQLKGDRRETWSIKVSGNWRITFTFINNDAYDLNLEDYH
ncbi:MAG: type II toxin-antitoxin system RelE/ParE family toxin [Microcystis panniformis]|jgi:proteic killer suppression protein|uniref:Type II toxin-antitoxin system RelE/ParE family toxin n=6 Tax=Microcystis TaxID=1125 RepID=A0A841UHL2_MICAE|nr:MULTISPECIES: type II toxin-antitoxin system RelE/ParE family toxin [Microcystis]TRV42814.1 MAG: Killer protein [Microcystis panniformis Mp_GB_SS_20050300_S99]TRV53238.1 MAG: Killer protein [Microcystis panniformis Mp_MB_F_20080800_S26D]TRV54592.1 MAG: Killer protein [Microcystis panniformis Mp_GB_SS_20050300_S99D]TRV61277.1 MAG: Killer protein [Microcystis panniformis Mp_MB_F_20080800_S26]TRV66169.1 MAG: Killer protein [Microcystis panniformis Mp_MB_F_20051200_S9]TRV67848.1 MAG: Killer pr